MYTLSWHQEGEVNAKQAHNRREPHAVGKDSTIDLSLSKNNIIFRDIPVREAYHKLFDEAVKEYNSRTRKSRQIDDYYSYLAKNKNGKGNKGKQRVYEITVQLGGKAEGSPEKAIEAYKRYIADWERRNPNMILIGAYLHMDEPEGAPHIHIDYICVAECNRGMKLQNSLTRALAAQGFTSQKQENKDQRMFTAQQKWEQSERDCMREICKSLGIELHKQGIGRKRHLSVKEYKDCQDMIKQAKAELTNIEKDKIIADFDKLELDQQIRITEAKRQKLYEEVYGLQQQIQNNQKQVNDLQIQSKKYVNDSKSLQKEIEQQSAVIAKNSKKIAKQQQDLKCYDNLKELLPELQDWLEHDTYIHSVIEKMPSFYQGKMPEGLKNRHEKYYNDNIKPIADYANYLADEIQTNEQYIDSEEIEL